MNKIWTDDKLKQFVEENSNCKFIKADRRKKSKGAALYLTLQCGEIGCDKIFETTWNAFRQDNACRMCPSCTDKIRAKTRCANIAAKNNLLEACPNILNIWDPSNKHPPEYYSVGSNKRAKFICDKPNCDNHWSAIINSVAQSVMDGNNGCKACLTKYKGYDVEKFNKELHDLHPHIDLISEFDGLKNPGTFHCDIDDNTWTTTAGYLIGYGKKKPTGCAVCSGKRIGPPPKYTNSIWSHPIFSKDWVKYFDEEFIKHHTVQSNEYVDIPCPDCGKNKHIKICNLYHRGFRCTCNSRSSYPNKFVYSVFNQLGIDFISEYHDDWTNGKQYDVYNTALSLIVENHGIQHYERVKFTNRTLEEEQANDVYKYQLAMDNGIQYYIVLDCRYSEIEWIKNSIMNSELPQLLSFSADDIDWNKAEQDAVKNLVREVCEEWEKEKSYDYSIVGKKFHVSKSTVQDYLAIGAKHGWCSYNSNWWNKSVYCFQFDKEWGRASDASRDTGVNAGDIVGCCKKINGHAGLHPETGEELIWCFPEEKDTYTPRINKSRKPVICIETMKEYRSLADAARDVNTSQGVIWSACQDITKTAGGYHWAYPDELTEEKITFAKSHKPPVKSHLIYCVNNNTIYPSATGISKYTGDYDVIRYVKGIRPTPGKSRYDYKFVYDYVKDDGEIIPGAITLGLITKDQIPTLMCTPQNDYL